MTVTYNFPLVLASALTAIAASHTALELSSRVLKPQNSHRKPWLVAGAVAMGTGIWSMHFIAMLAFSIPLPIAYNLAIVLLSLLVAIVAVWQALSLISHPFPNLLTIATGSSLMGLGIAAMHYIGMAAMQMPADLRYKPGWVVLSVGIAIAVSFTALSFAVHFRNRGRTRIWLKLATACFMGGAVLSMHYTGMAAAVFTPDPQRVIPPAALDNLALAGLVCLLTFLVLSSMLSMIYIQPER